MVTDKVLDELLLKCEDTGPVEMVRHIKRRKLEPFSTVAKLIEKHLRNGDFQYAIELIEALREAG